ncbi:MAG TPA: Mu transposase C-terminal domain-containing protein [Methylococcus sp.]|nr:Mu transposase C-terminal domain-containing protein [Methylococcus sp.]
MKPKTHYTCADLAALKLPGYPASLPGWIKLVEREGWAHREARGRGGKGGIKREYQPPVSVQKLIQQRLLETAVSQVVSHAEKLSSSAPLAGGADAAGSFYSLPAIIPHSDPGLTDAQRLARDARTGVLAAINRLQAETSCSQEAAMVTIITNARAGKLDAQLLNMLRLARDSRGRKAAGAEDLPSVRTLKRWLSAPDKTPKVIQKDFRIPAWAPAFLRVYQRPQKPSVEQAYAHFIANQPADQRPSIHQVRRFLRKMGAVARETGRRGPRELKAIKPFVRRTFEDLVPNDIWTADGHTFDAEVQHPFHGKPFRPEITTIIDVATREVVGFSVGLAESSFAVVDALRHGITGYGVPAIFYVDNGSGYINDMLSDPAVGILGRFGIEKRHSLPYNSQARGIIERAHQTLWVRAARTLPGYVGKDMDREAARRWHRLTRRDVKKGGVRVLPLAWAEFIRLCEETVAAYNHRPHRSLPKIVDPETGQRRHQTPAERRAQLLRPADLVTITTEEAETLFRPRIERTVARGEIQLFNNRYYASELAEYHGKTAQVAYDIHDAQWIWVYDEDGRFLAKAEWNGNAQSYYQKAVIDQAKDKRALGRRRRAERTLQEIEAERTGGLIIGAATSITLPGIDITPAKLVNYFKPAEPAVDDPHKETTQDRWEKYQRLRQMLADGGTLDEKDAAFMRCYPKSKEYSARMRRIQEEEEPSHEQ